jgi:hypothetical protein
MKYFSKKEEVERQWYKAQKDTSKDIMNQEWFQ